MSKKSGHKSVSLKSAKRFINRELSTIQFHERVLDQAFDKRHPLLERLNFLAISAHNMDEFFMVRVAGLKAQVRDGVTEKSKDGTTPEEQLKAISKVVIKMRERQQQAWRDLNQELEGHNIHVVDLKSLTKQETEWLKKYFSEQIFPALTPLAVDPAHPFPFIPNAATAIALLLKKPNAKSQLFALIPIPQKLNRFIKIHNHSKYVLIEDAITLFFDQLFPEFKVLDHGIFRIIRDSEIEVAEDAQDLVEYFSTAIKKRRRGNVISLRIGDHVSEVLRNFVISQYKVDKQDIYVIKGLVNLSDLKEFKDIDRPDLKYPPHVPRLPERISDFNGDCFKAIQNKDIVVHHPYESFDVVAAFLKQAAKDPNVVAIKQTLYRTSRDSPIVKALIEAAEAGKSVTALVELKARFDEEANIEFARDLELAGAQVVYGFYNLKTHAKLSLVVRKEGTETVNYAHFGTGNYHPLTAKVYTDLSFFTCQAELCADALKLFNYVTGYAKPKERLKLAYAPVDLRERLLALIEAEADNAKAGRPAQIWCKMNSLVDGGMIDALYKASQAGVHIDLVVRGMCCLRAGVPGLSDNIRVKSLVGRFLEHSRIFAFANGSQMPHDKALVFMSSADWMPRNLTYRVEVMVPIENQTVHKQVLNQIMLANLLDTENSYYQQPDGSYKKLVVADDKKFNAHSYFLKNPSLSGRGKALKAENLPPELTYERK